MSKPEAVRPQATAVLTNELSALADLAKSAVGTEVLSAETRDGFDVPFIVVDEHRRAIGIETFFEKYERTLGAPLRRRGTYAAANVVSLLAWMERHCEEQAPVFGEGLEKLNGEWRNPKLALAGIGNYGDKKDAGWHDFGTRYDFPVTLAWRNWAEKHGVWLKQGEFAEFIETHIYEISSPKRNEALGEAVTRFLEHMGGEKVVATPSKIFELSRGLKITATEKVEIKLDRNSGEETLQYSEEHTGTGGRPLAVPKMFYIRVPVFFGQPEVLVGAVLRYRNAGGGNVLWSYELFAPDLIVAEQFEAACTAVRTSGRTLYLGMPDRP
ncbi:MAG TPA: DUF2303 family protein [Rhizomicrobium sp.]|jgi:uncharacterized protein YfdQ (DUF2303 family)|nr:DUF2303 family protein [Rhizomicrobium sp.]